MTTRILPVEEWGRLAATDFGPLLPQLNPASVSILVVEDGAEIIGCWGLVTFAHVEGLWVAPSHRKRGRVLLKLWRAMVDAAHAQGIRSVFTGSVSDEVTALLEARHATPLPPMFCLPLER